MQPQVLVSASGPIIDNGAGRPIHFVSSDIFIILIRSASDFGSKNMSLAGKWRKVGGMGCFCIYLTCG